MKSKIWLLVISLSCFGCIEKRGIAEFVTVVSDHKELCQETNDAIIKSLESDIKRRVDSGTSRPDDLVILNDLIYRLELLKRQSVVIDTWTKSTEVTPELVAEMVKNRWKGDK